MRVTGTLLLLTAAAAAVALAGVLIFDGSDDSSAPTAVATNDAGIGEPGPAEGGDGGQSAEAQRQASSQGDAGASQGGDAPGSADAPAPVAGSPKYTAGESHLLALPHRGYPLIWVRRGSKVDIRTGPGGGRVVRTVGRRTRFGSITAFDVVRREGNWAGVPNPYLPNGQLGWVRLDDRELRAGWTRLSIVVDVSERRAELRTPKRVLRSFVVSVGMPGSETPTGRFSVTDTFRGDLGPAYGCCAVATTANQPHLPSGWLGGTRIAIHGSPGPFGVANSHGCVRAADADVNALVNKVPLGTPVFIRS